MLRPHSETREGHHGDDYDNDCFAHALHTLNRYWLLAATGYRGADASRADALHGVEVDERLPIIQDRLQLVVPRIGEVTLRLDTS